ncbi:TIM barrel protein [Flaviaesturariibacter amylovorans]|uniref:L-rhamnose catabolism isomerase n=1 Tax=Flaviaesturariibacter amylovorans TaxID=1084520 RepID=A0ABP8H742_9BACT
MYVNAIELEEHNEPRRKRLAMELEHISEQVGADKCRQVIDLLRKFEIAIPSWALGAGGTRFGRFGFGGEPSTLAEKIEDVGLLQQLNRASGAISLHIPWDIPEDPESIRRLAASYGLRFDAVNSNTFQDQPGQPYSYKYGSLHHVDVRVRKQAIAHNVEVIRYGVALGSQSLALWLADGSSYPGQLNFRRAFANTLESMEAIYAELPSDWNLLVEYKAFEPNFYSMTIGDWGQAYLLASKLGPRAKTLVDLGHHLPNANIEQIVSLLLMEEKLGGFHFNDSKYGDDDLTVGCINPYQLYLVFSQLIEGMDARGLTHATGLAWMIDASHNLKDPLEDLLQSVEAILQSYAQALLVDQDALREAQEASDVVRCQELLQDAYRTDVRPLVAQARIEQGGACAPVEFYRQHGIRKQLMQRRGVHAKATGL